MNLATLAKLQPVLRFNFASIGMLVSYQHQFLFVHIPKTGGTSVRNALAAFSHDSTSCWQNRLLKRIGVSVNVVWGNYTSLQFRKHARIETAKAKLPPDVYDRLFKFCFVRNTWDLLVSNYHFILNNPGHKRFQVVRKLKFFDFIDFAVSRGISFQLNQITSPEGEMMVDYIGRFENMDSDFQSVQKRLSLSAPLDHLNLTRHEDYRSFYDQRSIAKVRRFYAKEIDMFGFTFDGKANDGQPVFEKVC